MNAAPRTLVLASGNAGKLEEFRALLAGRGFEVRAQDEFGVEDAEETGLSFIENAILKARHASRATGLPALADDSGLCVDALDGAPGLYSARYGGGHGDADRNIDRLLRELDGVADPDRGAGFVCALALLRHPEDPHPIVVEGQWRGTILRERRGGGGHGYDPVFLDPVHGQTAAEMPLQLKNRISHRGQALALLVERLSATAAPPR
ncbi:RdgB/HAM1 family non-canonical purine NTP pyrophosphatase [Luteimonas wenzhouensis]|jgi:XTP/dITP diphosphohydrolase|uniref:dITP/XTP pyrophosphatase n=1 Tax=Luteimonas wenzhouensis TaxID=2599615 RepID=A0A5C5U1W7_9GAMM|nr:RdgB/HAM1 family non-canonical purine NTP pyrophosphatase [Luteimonas wenzhouensis]NLW95855.1 RdgB/HAM1 family non-canonical purine NTP pyrophosphatase [Xanthomonadaceae bacterium]TWT19748.1 RdgB/HAM1 family non-canonical purine NTP pyrophosphatase [Luteimonas wenzhouensis]